MKSDEKKPRIPMNIQFFAEDPANEPDGGNDPKPDDGNGEGNNTPTVEELMTQLSKERAEKERLKTSFDKTSSELAATKKQLKERLTAEEQEAEAKREREEERENYVKGLEKEVAINRAMKRFLSLGMNEDLAMETAEAEYDRDYEKVTANQKKNQDEKIKAAEAEWLKSRPDVNAGNGENEENEDPFLKGFNS